MNPMDAKVLLLLSVLIITGIYFLPSAMARFAGGHTLELNSTGGAASLACTSCHQYIYDELNATSASEQVLIAHRNAAGNTTYTSTLLNPRVTNTTESKLCLMCHLAKIPINVSHTQVIVRVCTDPSCHGTNESSENTVYPDAGGMGPKLGNVLNVHETWFDQFSGFESQYMNETGVNYTKGYWTCMGCHTAVGVQINKTGTEYFAHDNINAFNDQPRRYL